MIVAICHMIVYTAPFIIRQRRSLSSHGQPRRARELTDSAKVSASNPILDLSVHAGVTLAAIVQVCRGGAKQPKIKRLRALDNVLRSTQECSHRSL